MTLPALRFLLVGGAATAVHAGVAAVLLMQGAPPALANPAAFALAFAVGFLGHHRWSFRGHRVPAPRAAARYLATGAAGLLAAQVALVLLAPLAPPAPAAAAAALAAAATGFLLGRFWAFAGMGDDARER